jgi:AraC family transcriptional regulator
MQAKPHREPQAPAEASPEVRVIAQGPGWRISAFICHAGPEDRLFEERHEFVSVSAVIAGSFQYHAETGRALLYPGAFLLGNAGTCFACGHAHGRGDRCVAFQFAPEMFAEIGATAAGQSRFRFAAGMIPAAPEMMSAAVQAERAGLGGAMAAEKLAAEELAIGLAERAVAITSGHRAHHASPSARDEKRISAALRHIEDHADEPLDLDTLAHVAAMSKYHFLRNFRGLTGVTPYRYLLGLRLRRAALALTTTTRPVAAIALDAGFGDISTFNAHFRRAFGRTPSALRRSGI